MRGGQLRDLVSLESFSQSEDARFGPQPTWTEYASVWAEVIPLAGTQAGTESVQSQGVQSVVSFTVTIRYRTDVQETDRIIYRGQTLEILTVVDPDSRRKSLEIQARSYAGAE